MAQTKEQILNKRVYKDAAKKCFYFRASDLNDYLFISKGFRMYSPTEIHGLLRDMRAIPIRIHTETRKLLRVYELNAKDVDALVETTAEPFKADFTQEEQF